MALTLVQLQTFRRLARLGNFTRTAEELYLTQSAVTQQMRALQDHFGTPLFDLVGRRPVLTDAGAFLAERSAEILDATDSLERDMRDFAAARTGTLAVGASVTIGTYALPQQLAAFARSAPGIDVRLSVANTTETCAALKARRIAIGLVEGAVDDGDLVVAPYANDRMRLIVPAEGHRFSNRRNVALEDLRGERFVVREAGSGTRMLAESVLGRAGIEIGVALVMPSNEGVARAVEAGLGIAILSQLTIERDVAAGLVRAVAIRDADLARRFSIVSLRARTLSPLAMKFVAFLRKTAV
jgi:DNA-binding transcriptional LysR family regulator